MNPRHAPQRRRSLRLAASLMLLAWAGAAAAAPAARFEVEAGGHDRMDTPVTASLEGLGLLPNETPGLEEITPGGPPRIVACQREPGEPPRLSWVLAGRTPAGARRQFRLVAPAAPAPAAVVLEEQGGGLTIRTRGREALRYQFAVLDPPAGKSPLFRRSGFIHPLWSPAGTVLSRIHPPDHIHHLGLWGPWTHTRLGTEEIDFWNLGQGQGTVRFARFLDRIDGPVHGGFQALQEHVWLKAPGGPRVVLQETLAVRVWGASGDRAAGWLADYVSTYRCATPEPLLLEKYRYGGLGFRATADWHNGNSDYLTSEGRTRRDGDGTRARWCDVFGETGQGTEGVLFLSHPDNHAHPEPMRLWPQDAQGGRGDVFFNFCPIRDADWELAPGRDYVLRYRLFSHTGKLAAADAERLWRDFADPPRVRRLPQSELAPNPTPNPP